MNKHGFVWDQYLKDHQAKQNELHRINDKIARLCEHAKRIKAYDPKTNDERAQKGMLMIKIVMMTKPHVLEFQKVSVQPIAPRGSKESPIKLTIKPNKS